MSRKQLSKSIRFEVFKRDGFCCQYCGATPPKSVLHVDHINPVALGGENDMDNLVTACQSCNLGKSARPLTSVPPSLEEKAAEITEAEAQLRGYHEAIQAKRDRIEGQIWLLVATLLPGREKTGIPSDWYNGFKTFLSRMDFFEIEDAADYAASAKPYWSDSKKFKYFCGICWNKIREKQDG